MLHIHAGKANARDRVSALNPALVGKGTKLWQVEGRLAKSGVYSHAFVPLRIAETISHPMQTIAAHTDFQQVEKAPSARRWVAILRPYAKADDRRALGELAITLIPFLVFWALAARLALRAPMLMPLAQIATAAFLTRLFVIQHDCGHRSFFSSRRANDALGALIAIATFTPYAMWRRNHSLHHSTSGNLDRRRDSDIRTLTVAEYRALRPMQRWLYRLYRHPLTLLLVGPAWVFLIKYRLPIDVRTATRGDWISVMANNLAMLLTVFLLGLWIGPETVLLVHVPVVLLTATIGIWMFYVQHQFEATLWQDGAKWDMHEAALAGSSHYVLPPVLAWFTGHIGVHHVHHLSSRIPFYRLPRVLSDQPDLSHVSRITLKQSLACMRLHLWDENAKRLISFAAERTASPT